jgi:hypothetical protein
MLSRDSICHAYWHGDWDAGRSPLWGSIWQKMPLKGQGLVACANHDATSACERSASGSLFGLNEANALVLV